jgi:hypothetical protein
MDVDDKATELEELDRESAMNLHRKRAAAFRLPDGQCANCDEPLPPNQHFCDSDCRDDYERRRRAAQRNGA